MSVIIFLFYLKRSDAIFHLKQSYLKISNMFQDRLNQNNTNTKKENLFHPIHLQ